VRGHQVSLSCVPCKERLTTKDIFMNFISISWSIMHGIENTKFFNAQEAKHVYYFKNITGKFIKQMHQFGVIKRGISCPLLQHISTYMLR